VAIEAATSQRICILMEYREYFTWHDSVIVIQKFECCDAFEVIFAISEALFAIKIFG